MLVTVLKTVGSVPRTTGAAMALFADGTMAGTVGGGAVEFAALETAHGLLTGGESCVRTFSNMPGADEGCCCGGRVTLLFQPLGPEDAPFFCARSRPCRRAGAGLFHCAALRTAA